MHEILAHAHLGIIANALMSEPTTRMTQPDRLLLVIDKNKINADARGFRRLNGIRLLCNGLHDSLDFCAKSCRIVGHETLSYLSGKQTN